jgi:hypothetical protein
MGDGNVRYRWPQYNHKLSCKGKERFKKVRKKISNDGIRDGRNEEEEEKKQNPMLLAWKMEEERPHAKECVRLWILKRQRTYSPLELQEEHGPV